MTNYGGPGGDKEIGKRNTFDASGGRPFGPHVSGKK